MVVREPAFLFTSQFTSQLYRSDMTPEELYEPTRGFWRLGRSREEAELAPAVFQGVVREVYRIHAWYPAGTLAYRTRDASVKGGRNPAGYVNV